jgi:hypothetical protein
MERRKRRNHFNKCWTVLTQAFLLFVSYNFIYYYLMYFIFIKLKVTKFRRERRETFYKIICCFLNRLFYREICKRILFIYYKRMKMFNICYFCYGFYVLWSVRTCIKNYIICTNQSIILQLIIIVLIIYNKKRIRSWLWII